MKWLQAKVRLAALVAIALQAAIAAQALPSDADLVEGAWQEIGGPQAVHVGPETVVTREEGRLIVRGIVETRPGALVLRKEGILETWGFTIEDGRLRIERDGDTIELTRLREVPTALRLIPVPVNEGIELDAARIDGIRRELAERMAGDQAVIKNPEHTPAEWSAVRDANTAYLKELIRDAGWIDVSRFGVETSGAAIILAKHSEDLSLTTAILPWVEADLERSLISPQVFAVLFDGVQVHLGRKQRYGSQIGADPDGNPMVLPLESAETVDRLREEIGLGPLKEYLDLAGQVLFEGREIRMPEPGP